MFSRVGDILYEHCHMLLPIEGYENFPLMPLEEAVKSLIPLFPEDSLVVRVNIVKEICRTPADNLSPDESASIMLYTIEWPDTEQSFFHILNQTLRMKDRNKLKIWFPYLRLFIGALSQLPPIQRTIYRGVKSILNDAYIPNTNVVWWGFSSCTDTINILESDQFCGTTGIRTIFHIQCLNGRNIKNHSYFHSENEVLLMPGRYLQVRGCYRGADGLCMIQLDEIQPQHELLKLPNNKPWRRILPGISLLGICTNSKCDAHGEEVIIPINSKKFDLLTDINASTTKCPICNHYVDIKKLGFSQCQWRIHGIKQTEPSQAPIPFAIEWSHARGNSLHEYKLQEGIIWRQVIVEVKLDNSA